MSHYECGLLGPGARYHRTPHYLTNPCDIVDIDGFVTVPMSTGLGYEIDWEYIREHRVGEAGEAVVSMLPR